MGDAFVLDAAVAEDLSVSVRATGVLDAGCGPGSGKCCAPPSIGRFLSPDPLLDPGSPQSWNAYDYADDTPITTSDPTGACADADCPTRNCPYSINGTPTDADSMQRAMNDHPGSGSTPNNTKSYAKKYKADVSNSTAHAQAEERALERQKATADATAAAAKRQASGFKHRLLSLVADVIGLIDAYNCFTKGDVMGCVNTALTAVPWGKVFRAIKVGVEAFKVWRALDRATQWSRTRKKPLRSPRTRSRPNTFRSSRNLGP
ncbi:hypothetical protein [Streptomyces sp. Ag82_O1-15]|uniref:hypothetical protein n=1 Tax=Streptomyces sp. Ag82_O1-15 TaxID=1938855 RepID=UPI0015CBD192|nr:hypothetical protein [Streptomyces sp. Ag82_O1-15]